MTREELIESLMTQNGMTREQAEETLELFNEIAQAIEDGELDEEDEDA